MGCVSLFVTGIWFPTKTGKKKSSIRTRALLQSWCTIILETFGNDIPHASFGAERLAKSIVAGLFVEDRDYHFQTLEDYNELELDGEGVARKDLKFKKFIGFAGSVIFGVIIFSTMSYFSCTRTARSQFFLVLEKSIADLPSTKLHRIDSLLVY